MRYTINQIREGEDELILNYRQLNPEVEKANIVGEIPDKGDRNRV